MRLLRLEVDRLRNLKAIALEPAPELTVLAGRNGQGKTSLLESAYVLATGRSFRTRRQEEWVSWDGGPTRIAGTVDHRLGRTSLKVIVHEGARALLVDDVDAHEERARAAGAEILEKLHDAPTGHRRYGCVDPQGHQWFFAQPLGR